jgi:hypothetical protein
VTSIRLSDRVLRPREPKAPRWGDEDAVAQFVDSIIVAIENDMIDPWCPEVTSHLAAVNKDGWPIMNPTLYEQWTVEEAMRGNCKPLADLLRSDTKNLSSATLTLVAEFLSGERNLRTGRLKGKSGRPPMSTAERRAAFPIHTAVREFPLIKAILTASYPDQTRVAIHRRAAAIAAKRNGIANPETVQTHLDRPKSDRRRI